MINSNIQPNVDVVIPNYNKSIYLEECINSVINQTYKNWTLYLIDDNSSDDSIKILNKFKNKKQIIQIKLNQNKGPSFCRNIGVRLSKSKYISFLDSDDCWTKDKLYEQIQFMEKNSYDFTFTDYNSFYENDKGKLIPTNIQNQFNFYSFIKNSSINTSTMILNRNIIGYTKFKNVKLEDYLFKCDILKKNIFAYKFKAHSAFYRIIDSSRSKNKIDNIINLWKINKKFNNLSFINNLSSVFSISLNSIKKYGIK